MAKRRRRRASRSGSCKRVKGGGCLCRLTSGKVKFAKKSRCRR